MVKIIVEKIEKAKKSLNINVVVIGGGVAANSEIRRVLKDKSVREKWEVFLPQFQYTTDNAAMVGIVGYHKLKKNKLGGMNQSVNTRLPF